MNQTTTYRNRKGISPEKIFQQIRNTFPFSYMYDDSSDNTLFVKNIKNQPQFTVNVEDGNVYVSIANPMLMDLNDSKAFNDLIESILN
ncbi:hypothetical protein [Pedobacter sp. ok626]|uniref:hypothetical protein n=1 Tax=Pedobacter sp. ok626 TaxID=1761882 RepID=UPI000B85561D|nr:hypothetical protein [Pedobacter sp. ok626]